MGVAKLSEMPKPTPIVKQMSKRSNRAPRGGWRQRASTDSQGIWETHQTVTSVEHAEATTTPAESITPSWSSVGVGEGTYELGSRVIPVEQSPLGRNTHVRLCKDNPLGRTSHYGRPDRP